MCYRAVVLRVQSMNSVEPIRPYAVLEYKNGILAEVPHLSA